MRPAINAKLYAEIGRLKMELDWLKKNLISSANRKRALIEADHPTLSIRRQCELLNLSRSSLYYQQRPVPAETLLVMRQIDEIATKWPFYGARKIAAELRGEGMVIDRKRVGRLMRRMWIEAVYARPKTSRSHPAHRKYPYLLRDVVIERADQAWGTDITYIPM